MKKKIIVMLLVVAMVPAMIFASSDILQLGLNIGYRPTLESLMNDPATDWKDYFKQEYFSFAPELKLNLWFIDLDTTAQFSFIETGTLINTEIAADLYFKLGFFKLAGGVGLNMPFFYNKEQSAWYLNGALISANGFGDAFMNSFLTYRAGLGFDMGRFNMMINYAVPTTGTFNAPDFKPQWDGGQFSLGLLFDIF